MILTIMLWLGMQQEAQIKACKADPECAVVTPISLNPCPPTPTFCTFKGCEKMAIEIVGGCPVAPPEHVFEIRTKREKLGEYTSEFGCPDPATQITNGYCIRVIRELWIDGKRVGIIKEIYNEF